MLSNVPDQGTKVVSCRLDYLVQCEGIHYLSDCRLDPSDYAFSYPHIEARADWRVREDRGYYVSDLLSDKDYDPDRQVYAAAEDHATHLRDAERLLNDALNLVGLMLAVIGDDCGSRAMQSEIALTTIEKKLRKAHRRIDQHDRRHTNLFLVYADPKEQVERDEPS